MHLLSVQLRLHTVAVAAFHFNVFLVASELCPFSTFYILVGIVVSVKLMGLYLRKNTS